MIRSLVAVTLAALSLCSCVSSRVDKLPTYDVAVSRAPAGDVRHVWTAQTNLEELPSMVPFALITAGGSNEFICADAITAKAESMKPDLVCFSNGGLVYSGSVGSVAASGSVAFGSSTAVYTTIVYGCCYRLSPVKLGIRWDETGMITILDEGAESAGLLEGDKIVSIAGASVSTGNNSLRSPHLSKVLALKPGDMVKVVWIRPGKGRMDGTVKCVANPPTHLQLADVMAERRAQLQAQRSEGD